MSIYYDSHSHLADPRLQGQVGDLLARAKSRGIQFHLQGGVGPEDWLRQKELSVQYPEILCCFGLHPYWVSEHSELECEEALNILSRELQFSKGLGEMGLDLRPQYLETQDLQMHVFESQLELAEFAKKPMVLHLVRAFDEAQRVFEIFGIPEKKGMVHSFNGSAPQAEAYLKLGLHLSVGGPVVRSDNKKLHQAVSAIPLELLLIETDSPDQPPPGLQPGKNEPESLWLVAETIGKIKKITPEEVLDISSQNLKKLFSL